MELVRRHCNSLPSGAAGSSNLPSGVSSFAETMAAWRFYNNPRIEMSELIEPLREHTRQQLLATGAPVVMLVHDWSKWIRAAMVSEPERARHDSVTAAFKPDFRGRDGCCIGSAGATH